MLEQEIDIAPFIKAVWQNKRLTGLFILIFSAGSFLIFQLFPEQYQAKSIVVVLGSEESLEFDPRIRTLSTDQPLDILPEMALSDNILQLVLRELPYSMSLVELWDKLDVELGADPSIIILTVTSTDPEEAVNLVNIWAQIYVVAMNELLFASSEKSSRFENQLEIATDEFQVAETNLTTFLEDNNITSVTLQLDSLSTTFTNLSQEQKRYEGLIQDLQSLKTLVEESSDFLLSDPNFQTSLVTQQIIALSPDGEIPENLLLEINSSSEGDFLDKASLLLLLDRQIILINEKFLATNNTIEAITPQIQEASETISLYSQELDRLQLERNLAEETYVTLARKVTEEQINAEDTSTGVRIASPSSTTQPSTTSSRILIVLAGAILGGVLGVGLSIYRVFNEQFAENEA
jgi:uncharacterized protein involved in exopolysaccharide biosynthesis